MITTRGTAGRAVLSFAQQVSLSVLGTLAATVVMTALKSEWATRPAAPRPTILQDALPRLTAGEKFAARALTEDNPEPFINAPTLQPILPLLTTAPLPRLIGIQSAPSLFSMTLAAAAIPAPQPPDQPASVSTHPFRPHAVAPLPPHRDEAVTIAMAPLPILSPPAADTSSFWSRSRSAYQEVADWSDEIVDSLVP